MAVLFAPTSGGLVLDGECTDTWNGDLRRLSTRTWREDGGVVGLVVVHRGDVDAWMNVAYCNHETARLIWLWLRHAAQHRPPFDVMYPEDLTRMAMGGDQRSQEA